MKNKEQFNNSIKVLVKAYFEGTLGHGKCCACAVGNLIASALGYKFNDRFLWTDDKEHVLSTGWYNMVLDNTETETGLKQINSTGYSIAEIILIEKAFEADVITEEDEDGYKGLCAVFDVLVKIHQGSDKELELAKSQLINLN